MISFAVLLLLAQAGAQPTDAAVGPPPSRPAITIHTAEAPGVQVFYLNLPWGPETFAAMERPGEGYYNRRSWPFARMETAKPLKIGETVLPAGNFALVFHPNTPNNEGMSFEVKKIAPGEFLQHRRRRSAVFAKKLDRPSADVLVFGVKQTGEQVFVGTATHVQRPQCPQLAGHAGVFVKDPRQRGKRPCRRALVEAEQDQVVLPNPTPERGSFYRSDHFPFAKQGVPALSAGSGTAWIFTGSTGTGIPATGVRSGRAVVGFGCPGAVCAPPDR